MDSQHTRAYSLLNCNIKITKMKYWKWNQLQKTLDKVTSAYDLLMCMLPSCA